MLLAIPLLLFGLEALWLICANLLLRPNGVVSGWVNHTPGKIRMDWAEARSYWPGDLRVKAFRLRGNHLTLQWMLSLDTARTQFGLGALMDKRFLGRGLRGEGVIFHLRRLPRAEAPLRKDSVVAPIPWAEFAPRPSDEEVKAILAAQVRPPRKKMWAVDLPGAQARSVREIWIDEFRYRGAASAHGSLLVRPRENLDVAPSRIQMGPGIVTLGTDEVLKVRSGRVDLSFAKVNTVVYRGSAVFQKLDAKVSLDAGVPDIRFVNFYLDRFPGLDLRGTPGELSVNWAVTQGVLRGSVDLGGEGVHINYRGIALRGDLNVDGRINRWAFGEGKLDLSGTHGSVANVVMDEAGKSKPLANGWQGDATLQEATLKLGVPHKLEANITGKIQDSRPLLELFRGRKNLPPLLKAALSDHDLDARASIRVGGGVAEVRSIEVTGEKLHVLARLKMEKDLHPRGVLYLKRGILSMGLETGGDRTIKLINAKEWFEQHPLLR